MQDANGPISEKLISPPFENVRPVRVAMVCKSRAFENVPTKRIPSPRPHGTVEAPAAVSNLDRVANAGKVQHGSHQNSQNATPLASQLTPEQVADL